MLSLILLALAPHAQADSVFDYLNSSANLSRAKYAYTKAAESDVQRGKIIAAAKDECGGRYEGTELAFTELSHEIFADKTVLHTPNPKNYSLRYDGTTKAKWLAVETIKCSVHGGHNRSVLSSRIVTGNETMQITFKFVNDTQVGNGAVSNIKRDFAMDAYQLTSEYSTPYGTKIAP